MAAIKVPTEPYWSLTMACLAGVCLWAIHFGVVYGGSHFACYLLPQARAEVVIDWLVTIATVVIAALLLLLLKRGWLPKLDRRKVVDGDNKKFMEHTARGMVVLSLLGVIWAGLSVWMVPACLGH